MLEPKREDRRLFLWVAPIVVTAALALVDRAKALRPGLLSLVDARASNIGDPWPSIVAARALLERPHPPLYGAFSGDAFSFIYPPVAALLMLPLAKLPYQALQPALSVASRVAYLVCLLFTFLIARGAGNVRALLLTSFLAVGFYPLLRAVQLNQSTLLVSACVGSALFAAMLGRDFLAGVMVGLTAALKPQMAIVVLLLFWQSRRFLRGGLAAMTFAALLSLATAGWADHVDYVTRILPHLSVGYAFYPNQSWSGAILRLAGASLLDPTLAKPTLGVRVAEIATSLATLIVAAWCLRTAARRSSAQAPDALVSAIAFAWLAVTLASPITWEHHFTPCIFLYAFLLSTWSSWTSNARLAAMASLPLIASYLEVRSWTGCMGRILSSYCFIGALFLMGAFGLALLRPRAARP
jgi:alpha-1,2-mannosyltransferase